MKKKINLNADMGESFGSWVMGSDDAMLAIINSANLACGFHAGDPLVMLKTIQSAKEHGVSIGAHPSYPDLQGFGRRAMQMSDAELYACVQYQISALAGMASANQHEIKHVKLHGALNNAACIRADIAQTIVRAIVDFDSQLILLAPALSELYHAGQAAGLQVVAEIFADRNYEDDGQLVSRQKPHALIHNEEASWQHVQRMLEAGGIVSYSGAVLPCPIGSICVHGDGANAVQMAAYLRRELQVAGYELCTLKQLD